MNSEVLFPELWPEVSGNNITSEEDVDKNMQWHASPRHGAAGQLLVLADLKIRGYETGEIDGMHTDIIVDIGGIWRKLQSKASMSGTFNGRKIEKNKGERAVVGGRTGYGGRCLASYKTKVDAFALVFLPKRQVYYIHSNAIIDAGLTIKNWSLQATHMSFKELLRRWEINDD